LITATTARCQSAQLRDFFDFDRAPAAVSAALTDRMRIGLHSLTGHAANNSASVNFEFARDHTHLPQGV